MRTRDIFWLFSSDALFALVGVPFWLEGGWSRIGAIFFWAIAVIGVVVSLVFLWLATVRRWKLRTWHYAFIGFGLDLLAFLILIIIARAG